MKKLIIYFSIIAVTLAVGCSKKLDVLPTQSIDEKDAFTSDAKVKAVLLGAYDGLSNGWLLGGDLQLYSELLGADDEITWAGTFNDPREIYRKAIPVNNDYVTGTWTQGYATIGICNNILKHLDVVNEDDRERVAGEARFIRGVVLFEMVKLYAKPYTAGNVTTNLGLQLITEPTVDGEITDVNFVPRSTVQETYDFILDDLNFAKANVPQDDNSVYATKLVVAAFLSRVYLQMEDFAKAREEAHEVIDAGIFSLVSPISKAFNNIVNSPEDIFDMQVSEKDGANDMHLFWSTSDYGARAGDVEVNQKHFDLYEAGDDRALLFFDDYYTEKWQLNFKNLPVIRLAEMYLTRAEANLHLNQTMYATPADDLNLIRNRSNLGDIAAPTLDDVIFERHIELAFEGQRIHDIKRLRQSVDGFDFDADELVFPIPLREINASKGALVQNDGY
jgi:starch-binding outer membrane protein, SusD/RagB family